ncbi:LacI family DNA-binding transcriptional regulator [Tessaracoccus lacteus]|uniref:LacI family DNA-binding transcriptional regulator n=1 Tax=Tessaracoccus lacteus TaxID=3041766 RepID=A0ABY8PV56_9ACTN|nr:LacI family DNA-binding transcriptional regulator [Tessaracoccus sp. T21]WGT46344.1 LacI family DNA-binding transcriptional regulator [Tessaracoccus sp. T21]
MSSTRSTVTIDDVARAAGVSRAAVSKVIRNAYGVSDAMRVKVQAAITELDYRPSVAARAMRGTSYTLGIELPNITNLFFFDVTSHMTTALSGTPYELILAPVGKRGAAHHEAIQRLADRHVAGLAAFSPLVATDWLEDFASRTPLVMIGRHDASLNYDTVVNDDALGARLVVEHLVALGHRDIAHLTIPREDQGYLAEAPHAVRAQGFLDAMAAAGLGDRARVVHARQDVEAVRAATWALLDSDNPPTAIFAGHDELALFVLQAAAERGLNSTDLSVVGYDDADISSHPLISLTTVNQSAAKFGERVARLLLERIEGRRDAVHEVIVPKLEGRGSTTAPKHR